MLKKNRDILTNTAEAIKEKFGTATVIYPEEFERAMMGSGNTSVGLKNQLKRFVEGGFSALRDDATSIKQRAFTDMEDLQLVELPYCKYVNYGAFDGCTSLSKVEMIRCLSIRSRAFAGTALSRVAFPECVTIQQTAFASISNLTTISLPACLGIDAFAFTACNVKSLYLPKCITLKYGAFRGCSALTEALLPEVRSLDKEVFSSCTNLVSVSIPQVTTIGSEAFEGCNLSAIALPNCSFIKDEAFYSNTRLSEVYMPKVITIGSDAFNNCNIEVVDLPNCTSIGWYAFRRNSNLRVVNLPKIRTIASDAFQGCYKLSQVFLGGSSVCSLERDIFHQTPFEGYSSYFSGVPRIYVPSELVSAYKADSEWSRYASMIVSNEHTEFEDDKISCTVSSDFWDIPRGQNLEWLMLQDKGYTLNIINKRYYALGDSIYDENVKGWELWNMLEQRYAKPTDILTNGIIFSPHETYEDPSEAPVTLSCFMHTNTDDAGWWIDYKQIDHSITVKNGMTWIEWLQSDYNWADMYEIDGEDRIVLSLPFNIDGEDFIQQFYIYADQDYYFPVKINDLIQQETFWLFETDYVP